MPRRIVSEGEARLVVQDGISSGSSSFDQFCNTNVSFIDKTLVIEAFLRNPGSHHLILRPRYCGKTHALSMMREFLQRPYRLESHHSRDITTSMFESTAIADPRYNELVSTHFQQYPVLYIDLKDVRGNTFEKMLASFDSLITRILHELSNPFDGVKDQNFVLFCRNLRHPKALKQRRSMALKAISQDLRNVFNKPVVVLIDEYDSPMHSAIQHGYADLATNFFARVFGSLLENNNAVCASMMVGVCNAVKSSGWLSSHLNHLEIFPMHAEDDRYAKFFLFTEKEVEIFCNTYGQLSFEALRMRYDGYAARCNTGLVKLYNPVSIARALQKNSIRNFWVEAGRPSPMGRHMWSASSGFHDSLDLLLTQKSVKVVIDDNINFLRPVTSDDTSISDPGLWGLLYYTGYLTIQGFGELTSEYIFRIPNREVTEEWHQWMMGYISANKVMSRPVVYNTIVCGDAEGFRTQFTAFLHECFARYCTPHHEEKVYQALCYMLIFALSGKGYDIRMEQDAGHGGSDITAQPFDPQCFQAHIFEIKAVAGHSTRDGKRSLKTDDHITEDLEKAKTEALTQIEERRYRARVPLHAREVKEYAFVFCGEFCVAAVRNFERNDMGDWELVNESTTCVSECMGVIGEEIVDDEDEDT